MTTANIFVTGAGDYTNLTVVGLPTNWEAVSDHFPDDTNAYPTYVHTTSVTEVKDAYAITNTLPSGAIPTSVKMWSNSQRSNFSSLARPALRLSGVEVAGGPYIPPSGYTWSGEIIARPGGGSWSRSDIDSLQAVIGLWNTVGTETYCYSVYLEIAYTIAPSVTQQSVTSISGTTATGNGNVTNIGDPASTQHGHCWKVWVSGSPPTTADSKTTKGVPVAGAFTSSITTLTAGVKYGVRAYITNSSGTYYSVEVEFWADKGTVSPTDPITRVSGIVRTFWSGAGGQASYQAQLSCGGISTTYVPPVGPRELPGVEPTPTPQTATEAYAKAGAGYQQEDYLRWLTNSDNVRVYIQVFGRFPTYEMWLTNVVPGRVHQFK
jgi:hypothetical protein